MPRGLTTICHASRSSVGATKCSSHVWISDDLLAHTFSAFVKTHRRHGSNVPGPLEARKRAAKRRTTTLAQISPTHPDPAIVMGSVAQSGWWKQSEPTKTSAKPSFWPIFAGRPHVPPPAPVAMPFPAESEATNKQRFYEELDRIRTFEELVTQLEQCSIGSISQNPGLAQDIMHSMFKGKWDFGEIEKFLLDPLMNPAGNLLFRHTFRQGLKSKPWQWFARHLVSMGVPMQAARLGLLCEKDLIAIFFFITKEDEFLFNSRNNSADFLHALLDELEQSGVTDMSSVCNGMLPKLRKLMGIHFYPSTPLLVSRLSEHIDHKHTLSDTVICCLGHISENTGPRLRYLVNFILSQPRPQANRMIFQITERLVSQNDDKRSYNLSGLPEEGYPEASMRAALIANLEKADDSTMVDRQNSREAIERIFEELASEGSSVDGTDARKGGDATPLQVWYAVLAGVGSNREVPFVAEKRFFKDFIKHQSFLSRRERILIGFWIAMALSVRNNTSINASGLQLTGQYALYKYGRECQTQGEDLLASVIMELHHLPLPAKNKLLHRMCSFSGGLLHVKVNYWQLLSLYMLIEKDQHYILRDKTLYKLMKRHYPAMLEKLSESFNSDLAAFEQTARSIISETKGSTKLILRLLAHNSELKFALRHASNVIQWNGVRFTATTTDTRGMMSAKAMGQYSYIDIVNMINNLAWDCARSEMLSPRLAFRFTWWLLMYLHMHRAPVLPTILEAVWHSAVVRNPNISYSVVRLLHSYNLEYLGEDGAMSLLLNSQYHATEEVLASKPLRKTIMSGGEAVAGEFLTSGAGKGAQPAEMGHQEGQTVFMPFANEEECEDLLEGDSAEPSDGNQDSA